MQPFSIFKICRQPALNAVKNAGRSHRAFSLIEILIVGMISAIMILSAAGFLLITVTNQKIQKQRSVANALAMSEMEKVKRTLFSHLEPRTIDVTIDDNRTPDDTSDDTTGILQTILLDSAGSEIATHPATREIITVKVFVSWYPPGSRSGRQLTEKLITRLAPQ